MAAKPLEWLFNLFDRMSGPAEGIASAVKKADSAMEAASKAAAALEAAQARGALATASATAATTKATDAAKKAADAAGADKALNEAAALAAHRATLAKAGQTAATEKLTAAQKAAEEATKKASGAAGEAADAHKKGKEHTEGWRHQLFEWIEIAHRGIEVIHALGEKVWELGKRMLEAAGHSERVAMSFKLLLGNEGGEDVLSYLAQIQKHTQFTKAQLESLAVPLVAQGFKAPDLEKLLPAALDVGAMFGGSQEAVAGALEVFTRIKATSRLESRELVRLGVAANDVLGPLAKMLHTDVKGVKERMEAGKIKPDQLLDAIFNAIQAKTGGPLGTAGLQAGTTLDALLNKVQGLPEAMFAHFDTSPAFASFKGFLGNLLQLLDPESEFGARARAQLDKVFGGVFGRLFGDLSGADGAAKMGASLGRLLDTLEKIPGYLDDAMPYLQGFWDLCVGIGYVVWGLWEALKLLGEGLGWLAAQIYLGVVWLMELGEAIGDGLGRAVAAVFEFGQGVWDWITDLPRRLWQGAMAIGTAIWQGMRDGVLGGLSAVGEAVGGLADSAISGLKGLLGISSPSRVTRQIGRWTSQGMALGITDSAGMIDDAWANAVAIDDVAAASPYGRGELRQGVGGGPVFQITLEVNVDAQANDPQQLADEVVERIQERVPSMLEAAAAQLAAEWGAGG